MTDWRSLPKVELHCHLLGIIGPPLLQRIQDAGGRVLVDPDLLRQVYPINNLSKFKQWLEVLKPYQSTTPEIMRPILAAHAAELIRQRVLYTEIMLSRTLFPPGQQDLLRAFHQWREWTLELEQGQVQIEYVIVIPRTLDENALERDVVAFLELHRAGLIAGVALVGVETGQSLARFSRAFARWRDAGLGIEIHAGEHTGPESVLDALNQCQPRRLGHGLSAFQDPSLLEKISNANIHLELCPTSNLCTGAVSSLSQHPINRARELGLSYSINTDDPGAFECSLESEFRLLNESLSFDSADFLKVYQNSLAARFQPKLRYLSGAGATGEL